MVKSVKFKKKTIENIQKNKQIISVIFTSSGKKCYWYVSEEIEGLIAAEGASYYC